MSAFSRTTFCLAMLSVLFHCHGLRADSPWAADDQASTMQNIPVVISVLANDAGTNQLGILRVTQPAHGRVTINAGGAVSNPELDRLFQFAAVQMSNTVAEIVNPYFYPWVTATNGYWYCDPAWDNNWVSGFFPGELWLVYEHTGDTNYRAWAESWMVNIAPMQYSTNVDDVGFMVNTSFGNGYRLTGNPDYQAVLLQAAQSLSMRFNPIVGCLAGDRLLTPPPFEVLLDTIMNSELLYRAHDLGGSTNFYNMALSHAGRAMTNQIRADGSTFHRVIYDANTGGVLSQGTRAGYSDASTWARGQAWAIYGFTMAYRETGDTRFVNAAGRVADYYIQNVPADYVPFWDFNDPAIPNAQKDSSAAAITLSGLLELSQLATNSADAARYWQAARNIFSSLSSTNYLAQGSISQGILLHGDSVDSQTDASLIYGDYYFVQALKRFSDVYKQTTVTYTPEPGFSGADSFTYQVGDSGGACATATVTVGVSPAVPNPTVSISGATHWPVISFQALSGHSYFVQCANDLAAAQPWSILATNIVGAGAMVTITDSNRVSQRFYRVGTWQ